MKKCLLSPKITLLGKEDLIELLLRDDSHMMRRLLLEDQFLSTLKKIILRDEVAYQSFVVDRMRKFSYHLPSYLISYPRSGSNFLQSVLEASSNIRCRSIYRYPRVDPHRMLSLKSHSLSYQYLLDEISRLVPDSPFPEKLILLHRDPRDVMISLYEFVQVRKGIRINQSEFLDDVDFFYATFQDRDMTLHRGVEYSPISIAESYQKYVHNWFVNKPGDQECLPVAFEDLVLSPRDAFQRIFDFLELDCSLAEERLVVKVSQYSQEDRPRGKVGSWRVCQDKYLDLISAVNTSIQTEIRLLGYEDLNC